MREWGCRVGGLGGNTYVRAPVISSATLQQMHAQRAVWALPGDQHCRVMAGDAVLRDSVSIAVPVHDGFLPLAEAVQGLPGMVVNLQSGLEGKQSCYVPKETMTR